MNKHMIVMIAGSTGAGKTTIINKVIEKLGKDSIDRFASCTTRPMRNGEVDGKDYYFLSEDEFYQKIQTHQIVEAKRVYGNLYGTYLPAIHDTLSHTKIAIKDFDVDGYRNAKERINLYRKKQGKEPLPIITILVDIPDNELIERVKSRNDNTNVAEREKELIKDRIIKNKNRYRYNYHITNENLDKSVNQICEIIKSEFYKQTGQSLTTTQENERITG